MAVGFEPVVKVDLIKIGRDDFFAEFVGVCADEWQAQSGEYRKQRLRNAVRISGSIRVFRFDFRQGRRHHKQTVGELSHAVKAIYEHSAVCCKRADQVRKIFSLDHAAVFHAFNRIVSQTQSAMFDLCKPSFEAAERKRVLFARVDDCDGQRSAELRASALGYDWKRGWRDRSRL